MDGKTVSKAPVRDAATLIILRRSGDRAEVLMGERSRGHVFFPEHYVFPGGRVDRADGYVPAARDLRPEVMDRLSSAATPHRARAIALAAVRETFEEAGLIVGEPHGGAVPSRVRGDWHAFFKAGYAPALDGLTYVHRAVTPPGRPRRFNARFFVVDAEHGTGGLGEGSGELLKLHWFAVAEARKLKIRPITAMVLEEIETRVDGGRLHDMSRPVPAVMTRYGRRVVEYD